MPYKYIMEKWASSLCPCLCRISLLLLRLLLLLVLYCVIVCNAIRHMHNKSHRHSMLKHAKILWMESLYLECIFPSLNLLYRSILMASPFYLFYPIQFCFYCISFHFILQFSLPCSYFNCYLFCKQILGALAFVFPFFAVFGIYQSNPLVFASFNFVHKTSKIHLIFFKEKNRIKTHNLFCSFLWKM